MAIQILKKGRVHGISATRFAGNLPWVGRGKAALSKAMMGIGKSFMEMFRVVPKTLDGYQKAFKTSQDEARSPVANFNKLAPSSKRDFRIYPYYSSMVVAWVEQRLRSIQQALRTSKLLVLNASEERLGKNTLESRCLNLWEGILKDVVTVNNLVGKGRIPVGKLPSCTRNRKRTGSVERIQGRSLSFYKERQADISARTCEIGQFIKSKTLNLEGLWQDFGKVGTAGERLQGLGKLMKLDYQVNEYYRPDYCFNTIAGLRSNLVGENQARESYGGQLVQLDSRKKSGILFIRCWNCKF